MVILNIFVYICATFFYSISIIGYGAKFKNLLLQNDKDSIGEFGIYGFIVLYFLSILIHFFLPINFFVSLPILGVGIYLFFKEIKLSKAKFLINKKFGLCVLLFLMLSFTNQFHDDAYLYQLPYINYIQEFKIVFGLVAVNDYLAYGHGFYDILALFSLPKISNNLIFTLPVIFLAFFILYLYEQKQNSNFYIKFFFSIIVSLLCFRFAQSQNYGTDLPVLILIFLIQINLLNYFFKKNIIFFYKFILYLLVGIFFKIYMIFSVFYLIPLIFLTKIKNINFIKHKRIIIFLFFMIFLSLGKNIIHSGCLMYPIHQTCFESEDLSWSYGKDLSKKRSIFLNAANKGWLSYYRFVPGSEFIEADKYLEKYKHNYHINLINDPDFFHLITLLVIFFILINLNKTNTLHNKTRITERKMQFSSNQKKYLFLSSFAVFLFWFIVSPNLRYGGYGFIAFFLFSIATMLNLVKNLDFKKIRIFICIALSFLIIKNLNRVHNEISDNQFNIIPRFKNISYYTANVSSININISKDDTFCANIKMLCIVESNLLSIKNIKNIHNYLIIEKNKNDAINNMNLEIQRMKKKFQ